LLLRNAGDLADQHLAVEVEERFKHLPLGAGGDQLVGGKGRIRLRTRHGITVATGAPAKAPASAYLATAIWTRRSSRTERPALTMLINARHYRSADIAGWASACCSNAA